MKKHFRLLIRCISAVAILIVLGVTSFQFWRIAGERRFQYSIEKDVVYKTRGSLELRGDLYRPLRSGLKPAVLVVHGGSWQKRAGDMEWISRALAGEGYVAFNITYRLAPTYLYPAAVEDVRDAITWLRSNASRIEVDPNQIAGWGYSAGSQLILLAGLSPESPATHLSAIVAGGTPADLTAWPNSPIVTAYIGKTYADSKATWLEASPITHVHADSPPVFMYHGSDDDFVEPDQVQKLNLAFQRWNRSVLAHIASGLGHAGTYLFDRESENLALKFLNSKLNSKLRP